MQAAATTTVETPTLGPTMKRHKSAQDLETPWEFVHALEHMFGPLAWDLACSSWTVAKAPRFIGEAQDSFTFDWHRLPGREEGLLWLNPPFDPITPWVKKCAEESQRGAEILLLSQASIDSNWFWSYVYPHATVYTLDRIKFVGQDHVYPKPLILSHYHSGAGHEPLRRWRWKEEPT